jgi:hypothetical protein
MTIRAPNSLNQLWAMLSMAFLFVTGSVCLAGPERPADLVFTDLNGITHHPLNAGDKAGSVLIFYWQDCPISNSYAPELNRIAAAHTNFAFYIVQVDPELTASAAREHARKYDLHEPVLLDPSHVLVKFAKAKVTPEAVVIGKDGKVAYRGRIDDRYVANETMRATATQHDLIDAMEAVASGKALVHTETKAIGCVIQNDSVEKRPNAN